MTVGHIERSGRSEVEQIREIDRRLRRQRRRETWETRFSRLLSTGVQTRPAERLHTAVEAEVDV